MRPGAPSANGLPYASDGHYSLRCRTGAGSSCKTCGVCCMRKQVSHENPRSHRSESINAEGRAGASRCSYMLLLGRRVPERGAARQRQGRRRRSRLCRSSNDSKCFASLTPWMTDRSRSGFRASRCQRLCWRRLLIRRANGPRITLRSSAPSSTASWCHGMAGRQYRDERHVCSMTLALAHGYPGSLDGAASMLGLTHQKDIAAAKEVAKMWKPRKPKRGEDPEHALLG